MKFPASRKQSERSSVLAPWSVSRSESFRAELTAAQARADDVQIQLGVVRRSVVGESRCVSPPSGVTRKYSERWKGIKLDSLDAATFEQSNRRCTRRRCSRQDANESRRANARSSQVTTAGHSSRILRSRQLRQGFSVRARVLAFAPAIER